MCVFAGAGGGIGRAACQLLAEAGAKIVAVDANVTSAKETISLLAGNLKILLYEFSNTTELKFILYNQ